VHDPEEDKSEQSASSGQTTTPSVKQHSHEGHDDAHDHSHLDDTALRVRCTIWWCVDSTAEVRYLVLPERPAGTDALDEANLASLVTRDSMIGTGQPLAWPQSAL